MNFRLSIAFFVSHNRLFLSAKMINSFNSDIVHISWIRSIRAPLIIYLTNPSLSSIIWILRFRLLWNTFQLQYKDTLLSCVFFESHCVSRLMQLMCCLNSTPFFELYYLNHTNHNHALIFIQWGTLKVTILQICSYTLWYICRIWWTVL